MKYGLAKKSIDAICGIFRNYPQIESAVIYGSRAKGTHRPNSDIDLSLKGDQLDLTALFKIENDLDDLLLPYKIDLSIYHKLENRDLVDHIDRVGQYFFRKADCYNKPT